MDDPENIEDLITLHSFAHLFDAQRKLILWLCWP